MKKLMSKHKRHKTTEQLWKYINKIKGKEPERVKDVKCIVMDLDDIMFKLEKATNETVTVLMPLGESKKK